ncbi:DinB family protein [Bacillus sp. Marseille-Q3570]|uniref:DinB family protein n=1 Tax=Bacillus sp. Marseille-Q3570 TaxID=2963522 RepID=UPI0021B7C444|nr:DinB family protein [Bacillus sp. Marseille-Q3570]
MDDIEWLSIYKKDLQRYSLEQLRYISAEGVWSLGQMYDHVIVVAHEYLDMIDTCAIQNEEQRLGKTEFAESMFQNKAFPPIKIRLPDELNTPPRNPESKEETMDRLNQLLQRLKDLRETVDEVNPHYKAKHDGFGWLNAREWYDLVGMHSRHHLRQKHELEQTLRTNA